MIIGIDPGLDGALAVYAPKNHIVTTYAMPTVPGKKPGSRQLDYRTLWQFLCDRRLHVSHVVIEDVHAMPKQGVVSSFNFGAMVGACKMAVAALGVPYTLVPPATWKAALGVSADKQSCLARATQLFPVDSGQWTQSINKRPKATQDGPAEAALLAYYFWRFKGGGM